MVRGWFRGVECRTRAGGGISCKLCDLCEEGDTAGRAGVMFAAAISIHALREEGDSKNRENTLYFYISIPHLDEIQKAFSPLNQEMLFYSFRKGLFFGAKETAKPCPLPLRTGKTYSKNQDAVLLKIRMQANMLDFAFIVVSQLVKAQAVKTGIDQAAEFVFQNRILGGVQQTFKNRVLHTLSIVDAFFGDLSQPFAAGRGFGIDIVCDQNEHSEPHFQKNGG